MRNTTMAFGSALAAFVLTGCASMLGTTQNTVVVESAPPGASIWLNGTEVGTSPYTYTYNKGDGTELPFEARLAGYNSASATIQVKRNNGILFADAMLFHVPLIFDHDHPNMHRLPGASLVLELTKELPEGLETVQLPITGFDLLAGERAAAGTFNKARITTANQDVFPGLKYPEDLASSVNLGFRGSWIEGRVVRKGTTRGDEALQRSKVFLRPALMSVVADLEGARAKASGSMLVDIDWRFYSVLDPDSVIFHVRNTTAYNASGISLSQVINEAVTKGARQLVFDTELPGKIMAAKNAGLELSKGTSLSLPAPKPILFAGRKDMLSALLKAVATVETSDGHGSGFLITNNGYILTNQHVVEHDKTVKVRFSQGFTLDAEVVKLNKDFDLALLKANVDDMPALTIGVDSTLLVGEEIFAIGTPLDKELGQTVSRGILSGKREIEGRHYIQTDVSINPGNSGGPLIDETGKVVGVATLKISGRGLEGLGFGVPISTALEMLNITLQ